MTITLKTALISLKTNSIIEQASTLELINSWTSSLLLFFLVFWIGLTGIIFNYRNYLVTMFCIELMYLGLTVCFLIVGVSTMDPKGQIYAMLLLIIAASESVVGLGLLLILFRFGGSIDFLDYEDLTG